MWRVYNSYGLYEILETHMGTLKSKLVIWSSLFMYMRNMHNLFWGPICRILTNILLLECSLLGLYWGTSPHKCILASTYTRLHAHACKHLYCRFYILITPFLLYFFEFLLKCKISSKCYLSSLQVGKNPRSSYWGWSDLWFHKEICGQCCYCF